MKLTSEELGMMKSLEHMKIWQKNFLQTIFRSR